jgi:hypothetical protein
MAILLGTSNSLAIFEEYLMTHGKASTYNTYGCRCEECKAAKAVHAKRSRERISESAKERQRESVRQYLAKNRASIKEHRNVLDLVYIHGEGYVIGYYQAARYLHYVLGKGRSLPAAVQMAMTALYGLGKKSAYGLTLTCAIEEDRWRGPEAASLVADLVSAEEPLLLVYPLRGAVGGIVHEIEAVAENVSTERFTGG